MSEDYKKIAFEDAKKGQRVRIVKQYPSYSATYEGAVSRVDPEFNQIEFGEEGSGLSAWVDPDADSTIFLLEDAPEPKVVRTEIVTITHYDDGTTTTQTSVDAVPTRIETMEQFDAYEDYLKKMILKDNDGYYWEHRNGEWLYGNSMGLFGRVWAPSTSRGEISDSLPMTIVENVGD